MVENKLKFNIWTKEEFDKSMMCNHTLDTIIKMGLHNEFNTYLLHSPFFDEENKPIVDYDFIEFFEPVGYSPENAGKGDTINIYGKIVMGMVQFTDGCFMVIGKDGKAIGTLKGIVDIRNPIVVGNRFENKEIFENDI